MVSSQQSVCITECAVASVVEVLESAVSNDGALVKGVLDSGASHHMSGNRSHFKEVSTEAVPLKVADRTLPTVASVGTFKKNSLGLDKGLYHPDLSTLLVSVTDLCRVGAKVIFSQDKDIIHGRCGDAHEVSRDGKLPFVLVQFMDESASPASCIAAKAGAVLQHERFGHFWCPSVRGVECEACAVSKGQSRGHKKERPEHLLPKKFLEQVDWDFVGPFPVSLQGNAWVLSAIDTWSGWVENYPISSKEQCGAVLDRFISEVGLMERVRSDNAPEFKGEKSQWRAVCARQNPRVKVTFSQPYAPSTNGMIERWNRTDGDAIRANLHGVDQKVWDYCAKFVAHVYNRVPRKADRATPYELRYDREPSTKYFRKFGCLAYAKVQSHHSAAS